MKKIIKNHQIIVRIDDEFKMKLQELTEFKKICMSKLVRKLLLENYNKMLENFKTNKPTIEQKEMANNYLQRVEENTNFLFKENGEVLIMGENGYIKITG